MQTDGLSQRFFSESFDEIRKLLSELECVPFSWSLVALPWAHQTDLRETEAERIAERNVRLLPALFKRNRKYSRDCVYTPNYYQPTLWE